MTQLTCTGVSVSLMGCPSNLNLIDPILTPYNTEITYIRHKTAQ